MQPARAEASSPRPHAEERSVWLHNTMSGRKERFHVRSGEGNRVSMYCCGVTVYDFSHIGAPCHATMHVSPKHADIRSMLRRIMIWVHCCAPRPCPSVLRF